MPDHDDSSLRAKAAPSGSRQRQQVDTDSPSSDQYTPLHARYAVASTSPSQHDPAETHDDASDPHAKGSKAKAPETLRRSQACLACRKRKLRCDAKKPTCTRCEQAWLAYHPSPDSSTAGAPPCEYDTSILAKIFKRSSPDDARIASSSQPVASRHRDTIEESQDEHLVEENEQLRAQIERLQRQLRRGDVIAAGSSSSSRFETQQVDVVSGAPAYRASGELLAERQIDGPSVKRLRLSHDSDVGGGERTRTWTASMYASARPSTSHSKPPGAFQQHTSTDSSERSPRSRVSPTLPSVLRWSPSMPGPASTSASASASTSVSRSAPPSYSNDLSVRSIRGDPVANRLITPPLPSRAALERLIEACHHKSWLFPAINSYALYDVAALLDTVPNIEADQLTAQALMLACVATGLPLLGPVTITNSSSTVYQSIDVLLRSHVQPGLIALDSPDWIVTVTRIYADAAHDLLHRISTRSVDHLSSAAFVVRLLLVEVSHCQSTAASSQAGLALATGEARLLHLYSDSPGAHPRLSTGVVRSSPLARALRGLMQSREETFGFWGLFLHDCFQTRLGLLPVTLERQSIQTGFPRQTNNDALSPMQQRGGADPVDAYLKRRRGMPLLASSDTSMSLLVKVTLVLDQCCDYNVASRKQVWSEEGTVNDSAGARHERDKAFLAAHESIRHSRMMLSQYDDRTLSHSDALNRGAPSREELGPSLLMQDKLRFTAEVTHHLAVLGLFETETDVVRPFIQQAGDEARGAVENAAVWLSRLAGMALQNVPFLFALPSFCSLGFLIAARWLLYLQMADLEGFDADVSMLVMALWRRGERYSRDATYAKAIVALKCETEYYGRICISPFTWPIEAISEFVPLSLQDLGRVRGRQTGALPPPPPAAAAAEPGFVSVATLAASVDNAAVLDLASGPR